MDLSALLKVATDAAKLLSAAYKMETGGLFKAIGVIGPYNDFKADLNGGAFATTIGEIKAMDAAGLKQVEAAFNAALDVPQALQAKVTQGEGYLERAFALAQKAIPLAQQAYALEEQGIALLNEVRTFMGV